MTIPTQFVIDFERCDLEGDNCVMHNSISMPNACTRLFQKGSMWSDYIKRIHPPLTCPFRKVSQRGRESVNLIH